MTGILRNLNVSTGGKRICGIPQVGLLASQIPTGFPLPALLANDINSGSTNRLYRVEILTQPGAGILFVFEDSSFSFTGAPDGTYTGSQRIRKYDPGVGLVSDEQTTYSLQIGTVTPPDGGGGTLATHILETFETRSGVPRANLTGMRWYFWDQVPPAALGSPVAQGIVETTDGIGAGLFDIAGLTTLAPGASGTLGFTNSNGNPDQADLFSWFGTVRVLG